MTTARIEGRMKELVDTARPHLKAELDAALTEVHRLLKNLVGTTLKEPVITVTLEAVK